ncbi:MAG: hypothetical protein ACO31I_14065 [Prochlorotrichaceae cyanobacterium]|jgi:hypothetical protein
MTLTEILEATDRLQLSDKLLLLERLSQLIRRDLAPVPTESLQPSEDGGVHSINAMAGKFKALKEIDASTGQQEIRGNVVIPGSFTLPLPEDYLSLKNSGDGDEANRRYGYGSLAGKLVVPDDFNEPLEDLQDYM